MRTRSIALATLIATSVLISAAPAEDEGPAPMKPADASPTKKAVLVELFTSQG